MQDTESRSLLYYGGSALPTVLEHVRSAGWNVAIAESPEQALSKINEHHIHVGLVHVGAMQFDNAIDNNMLSPYEDILHRAGQMEWIGLFSKSSLDIPSIKQMIAESLYDFHTNPPDKSRLLTSLGHAYGMACMKWDDKTDAVLNASEAEMVGTCPKMQDLFKNIRKVAGVTAPLLITGESGTGKELAAIAVHERSNFAKGPFVAVNCGAIPATLIQSELFGYERGAFTGAQQRKIGHIESAHGGTIFLDEIGDLPLEQQINLLRFLQEKTIQRVGGTETIHVNTRVIAATHVDLERAVEAGRFREDLFYRLNVLQLKTPPLRSREGDIELMAKYFFQKFSDEKRHNVKGFSAAALTAIKNYSWPGNVRELINRVRRCLVMCEGHLISPKDLGIEKAHTNDSWVTLDAARNNTERSILQEALTRSHDNLTLVARNLGVSRVTLYRLIEKHKLNNYSHH